MVRFGRHNHKNNKAPIAVTDGTRTTNEVAEAEDLFRDVFADVQGALLYGEDSTKKGSSSSKQNPFDDDNKEDNININNATSVFKKKKKTPADTPLLDISETSATTQESHFSNSNTKNNILGDSVLTIKTSNQTSNNNNTNANQSTTHQWHQVLVATETHRQMSAQQQLRECRTRWQAWQQLVRNSLHETQATVRWLVGIHLARDQLLQSLELGSSWYPSEHKEEEEEETKTSNTAEDEDDELPEKPKPPLCRGDEDHTMCDTNAAALPPDNTNPGDAPQLLPPSRAATTTTMTVGPPIASITIPSRHAYPHEPVFVLFRQHNLLHQNLWSLLMMNSNNNDFTTESSNATFSDPQSWRVQEIVQQLQSLTVTLDQQALERVQQLEQVEEQVKQAWGE